jgi:hypothetical protein
VFHEKFATTVYPESEPVISYDHSDELGGGKFGTVYSGIPNSGILFTCSGKWGTREVAVKSISVPKDQRILQTIEADVSFRLDHPNLLRTHFYYMDSLQNNYKLILVMGTPSSLHPPSCFFRLPTSNFRLPLPLPTSNFRLSTSDFRLPTSDFRLSTSDFRLPTFDFRLPTSDFRLPTSDFRLLTSDF